MNATQDKAAARFWAKVEKTDSCWLWTGAKIKAGYGVLRRAGQFTYAHRASYEMHHGPIPDGVTIDHICHVRECVNPGHLRLATYSQQNENTSRPNTSGYRGVTQNRCGRGNLINTWSAEVRKDGKRYRSRHDSPEAAAEWARQKRLELFTHNDLDRRPYENHH